MSAPNPSPYYQPRSRSIAGPVILIGIGVIALLRTMGVISSQAFFSWFARYWPLILIFWGLIKLAEHLWARSKGEPTPRLGGGSIVFLVFLVLFGMGATGVHNVWPQIRSELGNDPGFDIPFDWGNGSSYEFSENFALPMTEVTQIKVLTNRGDIRITASPDSQAHAVLQKTLRGASQDEANRMNESTHAKFVQQGSVWVLDLTGGDYTRGSFNLDLQLPRKATLSLSTQRGNISVNDRSGDVDLTTGRGDLSVEQITGNASLHMKRGSLTAKKVTGDVTVDGGTDGVISDVGGSLNMNGSFAGGVQMSHIARQVRFTTSRTDMQFARLDGDLTMELDSLRANSLTGPFRLETRSKGVHLEDMSGDVHIVNKNATVDVRPKGPLGLIDVQNVHGEIDLTVPPNANFQLDAESVGGEVQTDFNIRIDNSGRTASARGTVGKGGPDVRLKADHGTIQIRKQ